MQITLSGEDTAAALAEAIERGGGPSRLADGINSVDLPLPLTTPKSSGHISKWDKRGACPPDMVLRVEAVTKVSRHRLRPDIFGYEPIKPPAEVS